MRLTVLLPLQILLALVVLALSASTGQATAKPKSRIEMELVDGAPVDAIELQILSPDQTRPKRRAVSDLMLEAWTDGEGIEALLNEPNAPSTRPDNIAFRTRIIVVSGGKLHTGAFASCGAWEFNMAVCELGCDGGRFGLLRRDGEGSSMLRVLIGTLPRDIDAAERPGFVVSQCGIESEQVIRLVPKTSGRPVEFGFVAWPKGE